jgi:hypothetical protein
MVSYDSVSLLKYRLAVTAGDGFDADIFDFLRFQAAFTGPEQ